MRLAFIKGQFQIKSTEKYSIKINEVVKLWVDYSDNN